MGSVAGPMVWVLEDQLSHDLAVLREHPAAPVVLIESGRAMREIPFHQKRLVFLVSAMRHFASELRGAGREVLHYGLNAKGYKDSLSALRDAAKKTGRGEVVVTAPSEHHTAVWVKGLGEALGLKVKVVPNGLFLTDREEFAAWARGVKAPVMETFYRGMRRRLKVLMEGDKPAGGVWNFDKENRKVPKGGLLVPAAPSFEPDEVTRGAMADVAREFGDHPGSVEGFDYPVTRADARLALERFLKERLPLFGDFEDAMVTDQPVMYHSLLSPLINAGLLSPMECVEGAVRAYERGRAPLNCVEGFVRQIIGWREYVYGIYWTFMPEYRERNARGDSRPLPGFFWDGKTEMNCLRRCIGGVVERGWSHHIQRLMVISNFATLAGLSPQEVNRWFYAMYVDSHDWVVTPNVIGMSMNADGGTMATKPYVSSGAYIDRMSDYCAGCRFDVKVKVGERACPFNYLYWCFFDERREEMRRNPRVSVMVKQVEKMDAGVLEAMRASKRRFIELTVEGGERGRW